MAVPSSLLRYRDTPLVYLSEESAAIGKAGILNPIDKYSRSILMMDIYDGYSRGYSSLHGFSQYRRDSNAGLSV